MFDDKRLQRRYPIFAQVTIKTRKESEETVIEGVASSISERGIGVYTSVPIKISTDISFDIEFLGAEGKKEDDTVEGQVVWLSKQGDVYFVGIFFNEALDQDKQLTGHGHTGQAQNFNRN